jgi:hypothetical protein
MGIYLIKIQVINQLVLIERKHDPPKPSDIEHGRKKKQTHLNERGIHRNKSNEQPDASNQPK